MKKLGFLLLLLTFFAASAFPSTGYAAEKKVTQPKLYLNGTLMETPIPAQIMNKFTMIPIIMAEQLGYEVLWDGDARTVTVNKDGVSILLAINSDIALVNGKEVKLDVPATIVNWRTMVPLRFIGEQIGVTFYWDAPTESVHMYTPKPVPESFITGIRYEEGAIKLLFTEEGSPVPSAFALNNPSRIVIDLPHTKFASESELQVDPIKNSGAISVEGNSVLTAIRYAYFKDNPYTVRVVLDLSQSLGYTLNQAGNEITIALDEPTGEPPVDGQPGQEPPAGEEPGGEVPSGEEPSGEEPTGEEPAGEEPPVEQPPVTNPGGKVYTIVIDAGHGGKDPGASGISGTKEKDFNLAMALRLKALLDKEPQIKVHLTRSDDTFVELDDRAKIANNLKADLFISIHGNAINNATVSGTETYYYSEAGKAFAAIVHKHLVQATGLPDRKIRQAGFVVIKKTAMPAILLESGYLTNAKDEKVLWDEAARDRIAQSIVAGIKEYLKL